MDFGATIHIGGEIQCLPYAVFPPGRSSSLSDLITTVFVEQPLATPGPLISVVKPCKFALLLAYTSPEAPPGCGSTFSGCQGLCQDWHYTGHSVTQPRMALSGRFALILANTRSEAPPGCSYTSSCSPGIEPGHESPGPVPCHSGCFKSIFKLHYWLPS